MCFSGIDLPQVEPSFIRESEILAVARDGGGPDAIIFRIGRQLGTVNLRRNVSPVEHHSELEAEQHENNGCETGSNPFAKARRGRWCNWLCCWNSPVVLGCRLSCDGSKESIPPSRHSFYKDGILGRIAQCVSQSADSGIEAVIEIGEVFGR